MLACCCPRTYGQAPSDRDARYFELRSYDRVRHEHVSDLVPLLLRVTGSVMSDLKSYYNWCVLSSNAGVRGAPFLSVSRVPVLSQPGSMLYTAMRHHLLAFADVQRI
jgi:hypothetical protein